MREIHKSACGHKAGEGLGLACKVCTSNTLFFIFSHFKTLYIIFKYSSLCKCFLRSYFPVRSHSLPVWSSNSHCHFFLSSSMPWDWIILYPSRKTIMQSGAFIFYGGLEAKSGKWVGMPQLGEHQGPHSWAVSGICVLWQVKLRCTKKNRRSCEWSSHPFMDFSLNDTKEALTSPDANAFSPSVVNASKQRLFQKAILRRCYIFVPWIVFQGCCSVFADQTQSQWRIEGEISHLWCQNSRRCLFLPIFSVTHSKFTVLALFPMQDHPKNRLSNSSWR